MMDTLQPWIDAAEIRRLAESLMTVPARSALPPEDAGFAGDFVGFEQTQSAQKNTDDQPVNPSAPSSHNATALIGAKFYTLIPQRYPVHGLFVFDAERKLVFENMDLSHLHFLARNFAGSAKQHPGNASHVLLRVGSSDLLEIILSETPRGPMALGLLVRQALSTNDIADISQAFQQSILPP